MATAAGDVAGKNLQHGSITGLPVVRHIRGVSAVDEGIAIIDRAAHPCGLESDQIVGIFTPNERLVHRTDTLDQLPPEHIGERCDVGRMLALESVVERVVAVVESHPQPAVSGVGGSFETRFGGAERERGNSVVLETGTAQKSGAGISSGFSLHLDGFRRETEDYKVPNGTGLVSPIINSAATSKGGAVGASYAVQNGYIGLSQSNYQSIYGTVAEADVKINIMLIK